MASTWPNYHFCEQNIRTIDCNWKLVQDAFLDGYHVTRLHKNTVGSFFPDAVAESDQIGDHIRSAVARNEIEEAVGIIGPGTTGPAPPHDLLLYRVPQCRY